MVFLAVCLPISEEEKESKPDTKPKKTRALKIEESIDLFTTCSSVNDVTEEETSETSEFDGDHDNNDPMAGENDKDKKNCLVMVDGETDLEMETTRLGRKSERLVEKTNEDDNVPLRNIIEEAKKQSDPKVSKEGDKVEEQMQTIQTKKTVEGMVLNASGIDTEKVNMTREMIKKRKKTNKVSISKDSNPTGDKNEEQMHIVQAKERGACIDPKESVTEKGDKNEEQMHIVQAKEIGADDQPPKKKIKATAKSDKKVAITQKNPNTRSAAKNKSVGKSKGNEKKVINSSVRSLSLTKGNKKVVRKNKEKLLYVDSTICSTPDVVRRRSSIGSWDTDLLKRRETAEIDRGGFGLGKVVEKQTEKDIMEITIEATLNEALSKFPDAEYFVEFKEKLESLFMVGQKNMDDEVEISLNKRTPDATCDSGNDNDVNAEEVSNQAEKTNPEPPKESVQLQKEIGVQQADATIDDPYAPSQYWYSPRFIDSCDKTIERITRVDATGAPSFSLDFSPMEREKTQIQTTKTIEAEVGEGARRALNLGQHLRSPYVKRIVDISALQNKDEKMVCNWIRAGLEPSNEVVSETTSFKTFRGAMEALVAGLPIPVNVIDSWIFVLNDEEKYRSDEAMRRIFFNTKVMVGIMNETLQMQTRFDMFTANLTAAAPLKETVTMRNVDLILLSDINNHRPKVIAHSEKFNALSDGE
ncbi:hypothetical protein L6452_08650 [Arctium lappa]|uniref:Uncharacterized protein n=1 Tax=Arctium lappa TaxID=4217 RepID=A0ACB9DIC2_ARCLA|nr:hypothetical protein L6452_08650 [Arctium lappa]